MRRFVLRWDSGREGTTRKRGEKMNGMKLRGKMVEKGISTVTLSKELGIARSTLWRKISTGNFTVGEAEKIIIFLDLSFPEVEEIFFPNNRIVAIEETE